MLGIFKKYSFLCSRYCQPLKNLAAMSKPALTIYIRLEGESEEHAIKLFPRQQLLVGFGGTGQKVVMNLQRLSGNSFVQHRKELADKDEIIARKDRELAEKDRLIERLLPYKELFMAMERMKPESIRQDLAKQQQADAGSRTTLEQKCFASQCRVSLIKRELNGYITRQGNKWNEGYWAIVHKIFQDLRWWNGMNTEFVDWVNENGYKLTENNFGKFRNRKKDLLDKWYVATSTDPCVVTARELYDLFAGGPQLPKVATYEDGYISHTELVGRIRRANSANTGNFHNIYMDIDSPGHDEYATITKRQVDVMLRKLTLGALPRRHKIMGTFGIVDVTRPGRRRRRPAAAVLREREVTSRI